MLGQMKVLFWAMLILIATEVRAERQIPKPLEDHPGNIFLKGEEIHLAPLPAEAQRWKLVDYEGATVAQGNVTADRIRLGPLPVGYYELYPEKGSRVTLAVISPLAA